MSLYKPKAVYAASEWNTLQQMEKFKYIAVVFTSDRRWSEEADAWIAKANAVLRELYRSVVTKWDVSNTTLLNRSLLHSLWNSQSPEYGTTSPNWEGTYTLVRPYVQNAPRKTGEASPAD